MTDREIIQREIASILDHPSVHMGGPSKQNMGKADKILNYLAKSKKLLNALDNSEQIS